MTRRSRLFAALLRLYPAAVRDEYGREMALVFADRYRDAAGPFDRARVWLEAAAGILADAPREHARLAYYDGRDAVRRLRASPAFALTSIATLAVAIAVSTTIFGVVNAVLLRPLPFAQPDRLVMLFTGDPALGATAQRTAYGSVESWRPLIRGLDGFAAFDPISVTLTTADGFEQVGGVRTSPELFDLLGVTPVRGRAFTAREAEERQPVALIGHRFWQTRFGGSDSAIGSTLVIGGTASRIIGVMPASLATVGFGADVWEPHTRFPEWTALRVQRGTGSWFVIGRLAEGATLDRLRTELRAVAATADGQLPAERRTAGISAISLERQVVGPQARQALWLLTAAALSLLLVAAANVAGLSLARGAGRIPELAIRAALGASRSRIARHLLAESITVATIAGAAGLLLAYAGIQLVRASGVSGVARLAEARVDWRVIGFAIVASAVTGVLVGVAPALTVWRRDLRAAAAAGGRGVAGGAATRFRRVLVVSECAVAVVLLAGAGLLVRSWWNVTHVDPGFQPARVLSIAVATPASLTDARRAVFYDRLLEEVRAVPGVASAGVSSELFVGGVGEQTVVAEGSGSGPVRFALRRDEIAGDFFATVETPMLRGRTFTIADGPTALPVAIVNEAMASRVWGSVDPVGRRFTLDPPGPGALWFTVVGVAGNMRRQGLEIAPPPQMFQPLAQNPSRRAILFVRSSVDDPRPLAGPLRDAVRRAEPQTLVYGVTTVGERMRAMLAQRRLQTQLIAMFATAALLLAGLGLYGLIQYSVTMRSQEIGIRMALGATAADIFRMIFREGFALSVAGLGLGLLVSLWLTRAWSSLLFGVTATDPFTFAGVSLLLLVVAAAACWMPARRAMRVSVGVRL